MMRRMLAIDARRRGFDARPAYRQAVQRRHDDALLERVSRWRAPAADLVTEAEVDSLLAASPQRWVVPERVEFSAVVFPDDQSAAAREFLEAARRVDASAGPIWPEAPARMWRARSTSTPPTCSTWDARPSRQAGSRCSRQPRRYRSADRGPGRGSRVGGQRGGASDRAPAGHPAGTAGGAGHGRARGEAAQARGEAGADPGGGEPAPTGPDLARAARPAGGRRTMRRGRSRSARLGWGALLLALRCWPRVAATSAPTSFSSRSTRRGRTISAATVSPGRARPTLTVSPPRVRLHAKRSPRCDHNSGARQHPEWPHAPAPRRARQRQDRARGLGAAGAGTVPGGGVPDRGVRQRLRAGAPVRAGARLRRVHDSSTTSASDGAPRGPPRAGSSRRTRSARSSSGSTSTIPTGPISRRAVPQSRSPSPYAKEIAQMDEGGAGSPRGLRRRGAWSTRRGRGRDHGEMLAEHGRAGAWRLPLRDALRVPLIVHRPGSEPRADDSPSR